MPPGRDRGRYGRSTRRRERGQAAVELALVLPVVVMFALVVVQAGLVAKDLVLVHHAAREAARAASVEPSVDAARTAAVGAARLDAARLRVLLAGGTSRGDRTTATVTYDSPTSVPLVGRLVPDLTISASVTMRVE